MHITTVKSTVKYCLFFIVAAGSFLLSSCSSAVRFSSDTNSGGLSSNYKPVNRNSQNHKSTIPSNLSDIRNKIVNEALSWIGTPYCYGGESKNCTDCSGFVLTVYSKAGLSIPRTASNQYRSSKKISQADAMPGDLVFFNTKGKLVSHVGIYIGDGRVVHASTSAGVINQSIEDSYLKRNLIGFATII